MSPRSRCVVELLCSRSRRLLIWWRWAAVSPIEGEVDLQPVNNVIDGEGELQRPEEETEHHEEPFFEGRSREWEEERSSSSFELRSASPKSPLVIPDSPNARAYLIVCSLVPLPTPCYPLQGLSYTYSRMTCSSLSIGALLGSSLFSSAFPIVGNHRKMQRVINNIALTPTLHADSQSYIQRLVLQVMKNIASSRSFCVSRLDAFSLAHPLCIGNNHRTCHHSSAPLRSARRETFCFPSRLLDQLSCSTAHDIEPTRMKRTYIPVRSIKPHFQPTQPLPLHRARAIAGPKLALSQPQSPRTRTYLFAPPYATLYGISPLLSTDLVLRLTRFLILPSSNPPLSCSGPSSACCLRSEFCRRGLLDLDVPMYLCLYLERNRISFTGKFWYFEYSMLLRRQEMIRHVLFLVW